MNPSTNINGLWLQLLTQHQQKLGVLSSGGSSHSCPSPGATPAPKQPQHCSGAATLPRYLWISSSTSYRGLPLRTLFIISESGDDSSPLGDSIGNPCLTSLSDKPGSQPRGPLRAFEVPERKKKKKELQTEKALQTTPDPDSSLRDKEWKTGHCAVVAFLPAIEWKRDQQN